MKVHVAKRDWARRWVAGAVVGAGLTTIAVQSARAEDAAPVEPTTAAATAPASASAEAPAPAKGILPVPDYTGDLRSRSYLTGDWGGTRSDWADKGVQIQVDLYQNIQSVVDGGRSRETEYGGSADYLINLDLDRMGVMRGGLLKFRAESRFGESVNDVAGPVLPVNVDAFFPLSDDTIAITVSDIVYTQFLSETFGVFLGKLDTLDADPNEFAGGRGNTQFMNSNFVFNPVAALLAPYSTLGVGAAFFPNPHFTITTSIFNSSDASTTSGFDDFGEGYTWSTEANFKYALGHLPGGQNVGFMYSGDRDFFEFGGRFVFQPGEGISAPGEDDSWCLYWSGWQYIFTEDKSVAPIDLLNGKPDRQGVGLFARVGTADDDTNPIEWTINGGIGGRGIIDGRDNDVFGVGYYYTSIQTSRFADGRFGGAVDDNTQGFEAFYNIGITPATHLTLDVQVVDSPEADLDTAVILGARLGVTF